MNLLINYCWGDKLFDNFDLEIYLQSLDKIPDTNKVLLVNGCNFSDIEKISHHYNMVLQFNRDPIYLDEIIYEFLSSISDNYDYVMICDSRDIIFQKNPFEYMIENNKKLYLTSEGMKVNQSPANYSWIFRLYKTQRDYSEIMFENEVINGGVLAGRRDYMMMLLLISFTNRNRNSFEDIFNQTIYSSVANYFKQANFIEICTPDSSAYCITGEGVGKHDVPMKIVNGLACNVNNEPYYIVHQWDRTFFAEEVRSRYLEGQKG